MVKILIVDDDESILELIEFNLKTEGYEVITAVNGDEALIRAQEYLPDLIILDVMMPKMDGVEVCERLRSKKMFHNTLILFLTARNEDFTQIACYESGGDDFIVKPIKPKVLLSRIKGILRRQHHNLNQQETEITVGDLTVDIEQFEVHKKESRINLAKKEFELLTLLVSKPGKLFTREEIFNKIWGFDQAISDRTIDVHIRKLREKIGNSYIKTIKGMGYKIEVQ